MQMFSRVLRVFITKRTGKEVNILELDQVYFASYYLNKVWLVFRLVFT